VLVDPGHELVRIGDVDLVEAAVDLDQKAFPQSAFKRSMVP
jgi:hypothetical protein